MDDERRWRDRSLWLDGLPGPLEPRAALPGDRTFDVAIVGAGYTGLWTAYSLAIADPTLRIVVLEAEIAGFGASGRNAGFVSAGIAGEAHAYERRSGLDAVIRAERAMVDGIDAIGRVVAGEAIGCGWVKGGSLRVATSRPQLARVKEVLEAKRRRGLGPEDARFVTADEIRARVSVEGVIGGAFTPHCARVNPAALARGLADACERRGVTLHERTEVTAIAPRRVATPRGAVTAEIVVRATEAYTARIRGARRCLLPLVTRMIATEPLPAATWAELGWSGCETIADQRHQFLYGQRTADGRIAVGGRGLAYRPGSRIREEDERSPVARARLIEALGRLFPAAADAEITHQWGGVFGAPRDWSMGVRFDRSTGLAIAGGYAGHGVVASSIAGRTLADLILGNASDLVTLPWVGHRSPRWEPEPLRWVGARSIAAVLASADRVEDRTGRPARRARLVAHWTPGR